MHAERKKLARFTGGSVAQVDGARHWPDFRQVVLREAAYHAKDGLSANLPVYGRECLARCSGARGWATR
jgi:hypothetical protein